MLKAVNNTLISVEESNLSVFVTSHDSIQLAVNYYSISLLVVKWYIFLYFVAKITDNFTLIFQLIFTVSMSNCFI